MKKNHIISQVLMSYICGLRSCASYNFRIEPVADTGIRQWGGRLYWRGGIFQRRRNLFKIGGGRLCKIINGGGGGGVCSPLRRGGGGGVQSAYDGGEGGRSPLRQGGGGGAVRLRRGGGGCSPLTTGGGGCSPLRRGGSQLLAHRKYVLLTVTVLQSARNEVDVICAVTERGNHSDMIIRNKH